VLTRGAARRRQNRRLVVGEASDLTFEAVRRVCQHVARFHGLPEVQFKHPDVLRGMDLQKLLSGGGQVLNRFLEPFHFFWGGLLILWNLDFREFRFWGMSIFTF